MARVRPFLTVVAMVAMAVMPGPWAPRAQVRPPASPTTAPGLPRPPRQDEAWTPPRSDLPAPMAEVARVLFGQGLADPRGCAYREVVLAAVDSSPLNINTGSIRVHAWVLPFEATGGPRYAVAWNGLVYPVARLGPAADLEADVRALVRPPDPPANGGGPPVRWNAFRFSENPSWGRASGHLETAWQDDLAPIKVVMLLRLGRGDLAGLVWTAGTDWPAAAKAAIRIDVPVLYASLAGDWVWALFDRATSAHARGDDRLAVASLRELNRIRPMLEARLGPARGRNPAGAAAPLSFLSQLPALLADQERRAREPARTPALEAASPDRDARIAALIRDLDRVSGAPDYFTGRGNPVADPVVRAVVKEGDAAVGPLLECLGRDDRLTRTVDRDDRHRSRYRHVQGVDEAAFDALCAILGTREFGLESRFYHSIRSDRARRAAAAAEIREYWRKNRGLGPVERLYRTLADDAATPEQWLDAAEALAQPNDVRGRGGSFLIFHRFGGKVPPPRGEPLRARANPSVTELMARRCRQIDSPPDANRMASFLAAWDLKGSLPTLRDRVARCAAVLSGGGARSHAFESFATDIARFTILRVRGGDAAALDEYAAWARTARPPEYGFFAPEMFEPLWKYPDHPAIAAASIALFDRPGSPWVPLFRPWEPGWGTGFRGGLVVSPMLGVPAFRKLVLAGLADDRESGWVRCDAAGQVEIRTEGALRPAPGGGSVISKEEGNLARPALHPDEPDRPRPGTSMPVRLRDKYADQLQEIEGFPRFELYWPQGRRDRTIAEAVALLSRYGERFRTTEVSQALHEQAPFYPKHVKAILVFPPLDRPATADDVSAGRAIFAAAPGAESRRWPMPALPMEARWTTLEIRPDDPGLRPFANTKGKPWGQIRHLQGGRAWQAEEIREAGGWRRYYGFVGRHVLARVPAEEMDFPAPWNTGWNEVSRDLDARLVPPGGRDDGRMIQTAPVAVGAPLPVVVSLRNHRGIAAAVPTDLARQGGGLSLREGLVIRVSRQPEPARPARVAGLSGFPSKRGEWPEIPPRREPGRHRSDATRTLEPTGTAEVLRCDLRDLFELKEPGHYLIEVEFGGMRTEEGSPSRIVAFFDLKSADAP